MTEPMHAAVYMRNKLVTSIAFGLKTRIVDALLEGERVCSGYLAGMYLSI